VPSSELSSGVATPPVTNASIMPSATAAKSRLAWRISKIVEAISQSPSTAKMNSSRNPVARTNATTRSSDTVAHSQRPATPAVIATANTRSARATGTRADHAL